MARRTRRTLTAVGCALVVLTLVQPVLAHGGGLRSAGGRAGAVPTWLVLTTGGGVVGASFLLSTFVTDREFVQGVYAWRQRARIPAARALATAGRALGVLAFTIVIGVGLLGPQEPLRNAAVLLVWAGWWAGLAAGTYLVGNAWPVLNPLRTVAERFQSRSLSYPDRLGAWPSVVGLLSLVYVEVVSPLADDPRLLVAVILAYAAATLAGAAAMGPERWFNTVDPVARVFRYYGCVAPVYWDDGLGVRLPGAGLTEGRLVTGRDEVAFVVALLWVTTYDGLVTTPAWRDLARWLAGAGVPAVLLYPGSLLAGFLGFLGAYLLSVRYGRRLAETTRPAGELACRFAPSLLAIAAGYHLAHFLGYFLKLLPALTAALANPLTPPAPPVLALPDWFGGLELAFVLLGHLLAIWVAHSTAYDLFPSRLQAVRSQYALTAIMILFTMTGLWIVSRPYTSPPFL